MHCLRNFCVIEFQTRDSFRNTNVADKKAEKVSTEPDLMSMSTSL